MNLYKQFKTSDQAEEQGVWVPLSATARIKVARTQNPRHSACLKRLTTPYLKPGMRTSDLAEEVFTEIARRASAETLLVGWEGMLDQNDQPMPYSVEAAYDVLGMKDFYALVYQAASSFENFREARLAELEKN